MSKGSCQETNLCLTCFFYVYPAKTTQGQENLSIGPLYAHTTFLSLILLLSPRHNCFCLPKHKQNISTKLYWQDCNKFVSLLLHQPLHPLHRSHIPWTFIPQPRAYTYTFLPAIKTPQQWAATSSSHGFKHFEPKEERTKQQYAVHIVSWENIIGWM